MTAIENREHRARWYSPSGWQLGWGALTLGLLIAWLVFGAYVTIAMLAAEGEAFGAGSLQGVLGVLLVVLGFSAVFVAAVGVLLGMAATIALRRLHHQFWHVAGFAGASVVAAAMVLLLLTGGEIFDAPRSSPTGAGSFLLGAALAGAVARLAVVPLARRVPLTSPVSSRTARHGMIDP